MTTAADGLVIVDKQPGWTSHDVVAKVRRLTGVRRVGHAGTLDPMATGVLLVGIGRATRLLGYLSESTKAYDATIRLGVRTITDDAEGETVAAADASAVGDDAIRSGLAAMVGDIEQVPSSVSAIKVNGQRSYARVRAGEQVELAARPVHIDAIDVCDVRRLARVVDVDVTVECSTGTYIRAIARDLGDALGVGGHLTALRRTRVARFDVSEARTLDALAAELRLVPLVDVARRTFAIREVDAAAAADLAHGRALSGGDTADVVAVLGPDAELVALVRDAADGTARPLAVFR